jgi:hypothetical protein
MKSLIRCGVLALAGLLACEAGADTTLCIHKKTGRVRAVPTGACKGREEAVKVADPAAQSVGAIQVYDANNQFLGLLTGDANPYGASIYIPSLRASFAIQPIGDGTTGDSDNQEWDDRRLYYASSDCSGPAYIRTSFAGKIVKSEHGFVVYENAIQKIQTNGFKWFPNYQCSTNSTNNSNYVYMIVDSPTPITLPFQTPVALPLQFRN